jgi:hypothetical protein
MSQLPRARLMTARALFTAALCTHLLIAGLSASALARRPAASRTVRAALLSASQQRDCLVVRTGNTALSLHQCQRRADSFAAAISHPPASPAFAGQAAYAAAPPPTKARVSLLPAASRAPPSLVAQSDAAN